MGILVQRASDVRVTEIDLSQIITSASSSVGAIVMVSKQGSATPKHFTNGDDFLAEYGNPDPTVSFTHYCAIDYFKNGNDLWAVRALGEDYKTSAVLMYKDGEEVKLKGVTNGIADVTNIDWLKLDEEVTEPLAVFFPNKGPGSYGNRYAIAISSTNLEPPGKMISATKSTDGNLPAATYTYYLSKIAKGGIETPVGPKTTVTIASGGDQNSITLAWALDPLAIGYRIYGRVDNDSEVGLLGEVGGGTHSFVDSGDITPDKTHPPVKAYTGKGSATATFNVQVYDMEVNTSVPVEEFVCSLGNGLDDSGYNTELEQKINPWSSYINVASYMSAYDTDEYPMLGNIVQTQMTGGDSGTAPTSYDIAEAWGVFSNRELYSVNILINGGFSNPTVQKAMIELAEKRGDAVALLDVPSMSQKFQAAIDYRNLSLNANTSYAALFCPDVLESDNINGMDLYVPFSGWAASLCAYTDSVANPSWSPAGLNRGLLNVLATRYTYDDGQASNMYISQVNYTRTFTGAGIALWEQRTLQAKDSALSWLSVRRIINVIKVSLYNYLIYSLQEPNDEFTARTIRASCSEYLDQLVQQRAISAYTVSTKTTAAELNSGIRKVTVVIIPLIPIHEIQLQVVISKQGASFEETLSQVGG